MTFIKAIEPYEKKLLRTHRKEGPIITVSGPSGSGKNTVSEMLAKALGFRRVSAGDISRMIAKERGVSIEEFSMKRTAKGDVSMEERILLEGLKGKRVMEGRLTGWLFGSLADLKIYVDCPLGKRAERTAKRERVGSEKALDMIVQRDSQDRERYKRNYGIDMLDRSIYDIIIDNSGSLKALEGKVKKIAEDFLRQRQ